MAIRFGLVVSALVAVSQASICNDIDSSRAQECRALGCVFDGRCQQPASCNAGANQYLKYQGRNTGVRVLRAPMEIPDHASLCSTSPECTAIYRVELKSEFTTGPPNCNDIAMLPPHGRNQKTCAEMAPDIPEFASRNMKDFENHPFPTDETKQARARSMNAQTALTEETKECWRNNNCAFPLGFMTDTIHKNKAICVEVYNAEDKWVEVMASSRKGSDGGSFCVADWGEGEDQACTKEGDLYECRESGNNFYGGTMKLKFFAQDNLDDAHIGVYWRIAASKLPAGKTGVDGEEKDAEDWCQFRDGSDYPLSLMGAYPIEFEGNPVFDIQPDGSGAVVSSILLSAVCALVALFM